MLQPFNMDDGDIPLPTFTTNGQMTDLHTHRYQRMMIPPDMALHTSNHHLSKRRSCVPQLQQIRNLLQLHQRPIQILPRMPRGNTEPGPRHENRHGRKSDHHDGQSPLEAFSGEGGDFGGVVEHDGHDGAVVVSEDVEAHVGETHPEVVGVVAEGGEFSLAGVGSVSSHDDLCSDGFVVDVNVDARTKMMETQRGNET